MRPKKEGVTDIIVREASAFSVMAEEYTAEGFKKSALLAEMTPDLRKEIESDLNALGILASHAVPQRKKDEFLVEQGFPENATDEEKLKLYEERLERMTQNVEAFRGRVKTDLTMDQIPLPQEEESTFWSAMLTGSVLATVAVVAMVAGTYSGVISPQTSQQLTEYAVSYPGRLIATASLVDMAKKKLVAYTAPQVREKDGSVRRKVNKNKIATLTAATAAITAFVASYGAPCAVYRLGVPLARVSARAVDFVWNNTHVFLPFMTYFKKVPVVRSFQWLPTPFALALGNIASTRIMPGFVQPFTQASYRVLQNVTMSPLIGYVVQKVGGVASGVVQFVSPVKKGEEKKGVQYRSVLNTVATIVLTLYLMTFVGSAKQRFFNKETLANTVSAAKDYASPTAFYGYMAAGYALAVNAVRAISYVTFSNMRRSPAAV